MPVNWTCFKVVISKTTSKLEYFDFGHQNNAIYNCSDTGYQWLSGVGSGAWFKLVDIGDGIVHRVRRLSLWEVYILMKNIRCHPQNMIRVNRINFFTI